MQRFLINDQRDKFLSTYLFLFITLNMFRAPRARHQERQIVSIHPLVTETLCWWPFTPNLHTTRPPIWNFWVTLVIYQESSLYQSKRGVQEEIYGAHFYFVTQNY